MPRIGSKSGNRTNYGRTISSGMIVKYDLQNSSSYGGSGTTVTDLQAGTNATLFNSPSYTSSGPRYFTFNGSTQYAVTTTSLNSKLSPVNTSTVISIFLWIYMSGNGNILSEQGNPTPDTNWYDSQIERAGGVLKFGTWPYTLGVGKISSSITTNLNTWYYIGFVYDGSTLTAYVNGQSAGTSTYARHTPFNNGSVNGTNLYYTLAWPTATNMGAGAVYGNFRLGALHIYNTALSSEQINQNYKFTRSIYGV